MRPGLGRFLTTDLKEPRFGSSFIQGTAPGKSSFSPCRPTRLCERQTCESDVLRISKKGDYAVFIMGYLAQNGAVPDGDVVSAQEIADRSGLHKSVVANLLKDLTRAALLESVRGIRGGYRLAQPAADISLGRILQVVEGPFAFVDCATPDSDSACALMSFCPSKRPMQVLHDRIAALLEDLRLPELTGETLQPAFAKASSPSPRSDSTATR